MTEFGANQAEAIERLTGLLGPDGVVTDPDQIATFRDPFAPPTGEWYEPGAVLLPASVEDVQAVLRIANELKVPVWTSSQGRNNGYGGAAPRVSGSLVMNLRRMNKVIEVDEEQAFAIVEPGVSFFDLYNHLRAIGSKLWMSCPDLGWGSVTGNTLDHGVGYTPHGDHAGITCGMEVVLPDGDILRTGMWAMPDARAAGVHKRNCGPSADALFMQSNFGVVTRLGVWLIPPPECYMPGWLQLKHEGDLERLLEVLRPLMFDGTIPNQPMIINAVCAMSAFTGRDQWYQGEGSIPEAVIDQIASQPMLGRWVMRFALYGPEKVVEAQREIVEAAFATIPESTVTFSKYDGRNLPQLDNPHEKVQAGIPDMALNRMTQWYGGETGGHIGFSCATPITARDGAAMRELVGGHLNRAGLDYGAAIIVGKRSMVHVGLVVFDTADEAQTRTAYDTCKAMVEPARAMGYGEYRSHLDFMDLVAEQYDFNDHAQLRFNQRIKDLLDPNGILSPGKQGIWGRDWREGDRSAS